MDEWYEQQQDDMWHWAKDQMIRAFQYQGPWYWNGKVLAPQQKQSEGDDEPER